MTYLPLVVCSTFTSLDSYPLLVGLFLENGGHPIKNKLRKKIKKTFPQHKMKALYTLLEYTAMLFKLLICEFQLMNLSLTSLRSLALSFTALDDDEKLFLFIQRCPLEGNNIPEHNRNKRHPEISDL